MSMSTYVVHRRGLLVYLGPGLGSVHHSIDGTRVVIHGLVYTWSVHGLCLGCVGDNYVP